MSTFGDFMIGETVEKSREIERLSIELRSCRFRYESAVALICDFVGAIPPAPVEVNGTTYEFVPPDPRMYLKLLRMAMEKARVDSDARIRSACDAIIVSCSQASP